MLDDSPESPGRFDKTQTELIRRACDEETAIRRPALERLVQLYEGPVKVRLLLHHRLPECDVDDLCNEFLIKKLLDPDSHFLAKFDTQRGRFRTYLIASLDNFVTDWNRRNAARARYEIGLGTEMNALPDSGDDNFFDIAWACQVLRNSLKRLKHECTDAGEERQWRLFEYRALRPLLSKNQEPDLSTLVEQFGFESAKQVANALVTARRRFRRVLEKELERYLLNESIDATIQEIQRLLARCESGEWRQTLESLCRVCPETDVYAQLLESRAVDISEVVAESAVVEDWTDAEFSAILNYLLSVSVVEAFPNLVSQHVSQLSREVMSEAQTTRLGDTILDSRNSLELLRAVKTLAKDCAMRRSTSIPAEVGQAIYFAAIASSLCRGHNMTSLAHANLVSGLRLTADCVWVPHAVRVLTMEALAKIGRE
jgi:hypothetical protein